MGGRWVVAKAPLLLWDYNQDPSPLVLPTDAGRPEIFYTNPAAVETPYEINQDQIRWTGHTNHYVGNISNITNVTNTTIFPNISSNYTAPPGIKCDGYPDNMGEYQGYAPPIPVIADKICPGLPNVKDHGNHDAPDPVIARVYC